MGEQTILCGMLQTGSLLCFDKMVEKGVEPGYAAKLVYGWETITEALKHGGVTNMLIAFRIQPFAFDLAEELKGIMRPLYQHMDDIMSGHFSKTMMEDWVTTIKTFLAGVRERRNGF